MKMKLLFLLITCCFQLYSMDEGNGINNVLHLNQLEQKAKQELEAAKKAWGQGARFMV